MSATFPSIMQFKEEAIADANIGKVSDWEIPGTWWSTSPTTELEVLRKRYSCEEERGGQMVTRLPPATCLPAAYYYVSSAIASGDEDQALLGDAHYHTAAEGHRDKRAVRP